MAVLDSKKLLPSSKQESKKSFAPNAAKFLVPAKNTQYKNVAELKASPEGDSVGTSDIAQDIAVIKTKVLSIEEILKKSLKIQEKKKEDTRKKLENTGRQKKEGLLEKLQNKKDKPQIPNILPRTGILDALKNFIVSTLFGFIFYRLIKYLPQIIEFTKKLTPAITFFESFVGGMADKLMSFIEIGYNVYDKVRATIKNIGGENAQKSFDEFSSKLNTFINLAIIAGMSTMGGTDFGLGKNKAKGGVQTPGQRGLGGRPGSSTNTKLNQYLNRGKEAKLVERRFGNNAAKYYEELRNSGKNSAEAFKEVKRKFQPRGLFNKQNVAGLAGEGRTAGRIGRRGIGRSVSRGAIKVFGKTGSKIASKVPIIGPLIDFSFRYFVLREPLGKAAAGAVGAGIGQALGAWIGGTIGGVAGSVVPIIGNILAGSAGAAIGGLLGGLIGDQIGVSIYETFLQYKQPPVEARAEGGQVTRGGRPVGGPVRRTLKVTRRTLKPPKLPVETLKPGKDLGSKKPIEKIFNPDDPSKKNQISSLRTLSKVSQVLKEKDTNFFSKIAGIGVDLALGQKPSKTFISRLGASLGAVFQELIDNNAQMSAAETARSILAMASGGIVPENMVTRGGNFGKKLGDSISTMLQSFVDNQSNLILSILRQESEKEPFGGGPGSGGGGDGEQPPGQMGPIEYGPMPMSMTRKQAFATIYELAKRHNAAMPELVAAMAMHESGFLTSQLAREANNPFGQSGSGNRGTITYKGRSWAAYNSLSDAVKFHVDNWNNNSKHGRGLGTYSSPIAGLMAGLPVYAPSSDGNNHSNYIKAVSSYLVTMGFDPKKKNPIADLSSQQLIQQRRPGSAGTFAPTGTDNTPLGTSSGSLNEAKQLAASMGLQMTSYTHWSDGSRRSGLHGSGRAMDFSNDGVGRGTPQQLAFAKEMIKRYGTKLEQLIYTPLGYGIAKGKRVSLDYWGASTNAQHYNHVHVAFKRGGYTGSGGVGRLHRNEMVMNSNAVDVFGRNTFEAMNAIGDKVSMLKISGPTKIKSYANLKEQTYYEQGGESTIIVLPITKTIEKSSGGKSGFNAGFNMTGNLNTIDNSIESALA